MKVDLISDVLRAVRLDGAFFYKVEANGPWRIESVAALEQQPRILPASEHLIPYHILVEGTCWAGLVGEEQQQMRAGDVLVFPSGAPYVMSSSPGQRVAMDPIEFPHVERFPFEMRMGEAGEPSGTFVCGFLGCDRRPFNPLLAALPELLIVHGELDGWMSTFARHALGEVGSGRPGGDLVLTRLAELMFVDVVSHHTATLSPDRTGWLAGVRDEVVGRALGLLHARPAYDWSLEDLTQQASTSRSVLAERFTRLVGEPPMQYLARWRMQLAARQLTSSAAKVSTIAREIGYDSEAAFSRAFKREVGVSPAAWRAQRSRAG